MTTDAVFQTMTRYGIVPVVVLESAKAALPLADALLEGGLPLIEITFRTPAAAEAISRIKRQRPEVLVGAGTLVTPENVDAAAAAGARFGIAPGLNPKRVEQAHRHGMFFVPGVSTASEIERGLELQCPLLKFFPAEACGGVELLKALAAPYAHLGVKFLPTGGVNAANLGWYLDIPSVAAVAGTWLATKADIAAGKWSVISDRCKEAVEIVAQARA